MSTLLTIDEVAAKLRISKSTAYKWVSGNKIPHVKMPGGDLRFNEKKIEQWIETMSIEAKPIGSL